MTCDMGKAIWAVQQSQRGHARTPAEMQTSRHTQRAAALPPVPLTCSYCACIRCGVLMS